MGGLGRETEYSAASQSDNEVSVDSGGVHGQVSWGHSVPIPVPPAADIMVCVVCETFSLVRSIDR